MKRLSSTNAVPQNRIISPKPTRTLIENEVLEDLLLALIDLPGAGIGNGMSGETPDESGGFR